MEKIMRLALANLRRHKTESVMLGILVMLCTGLLAGAFCAERNVRRMFPEMAERTGFYHNQISIAEEEDAVRGLEILKQDSRVTDCAVIRYLYATAARITDKNGQERLYPCTFITRQNEEQYECYRPQSPFSAAEIAAMEHPVFLPLNEKKSLQIQTGDPFSVIQNTKRFTFTVAGFYESGYFSETKLIVSDADYAVLKNVFTRCSDIFFTLKDENEAEAVCDKWFLASDEAGLMTDDCGVQMMKYYEESFNLEIMYVLKITEIMAVIVLIAIAVMIGFRVISDIQEQIVQIGVLEALGYRSREIALSYAAEYFLTALSGCIAGAVLGIGIFAVLIRISEDMKGYPVSHMMHPLPVLLIIAGILLLITMLALLKARSVRKYPPVLAFRKGIRNHHFGRSHFPLRNTRNNVHLRLALKSFASHVRQNIALTLVTGITVSAVVLSFIIYSFLGQDMNVVLSMAGYEVSDTEIMIMTETDPAAFRAELESLPEVRKVLPTSSMGAVRVFGVENTKQYFANIYADYSETENIIPIAGRFPAHDNELMISKVVSTADHLQIGDTLSLEYNSVRRDYLITGIVTAIVNSNSVYLTADGMKQLNPLYRPDTFQIYRSEGTAPEELRAVLDSRFGKSAANLGAAESAVPEGYEARIRARADQVMSAMLEQSGATHVEYAIRSGDTVITGSSSGIRIRDFLNFPDLLGAYMKNLSAAVSVTTKVFMLLAAAVVMMILTILMSSEIRRKRRELGIMKSMGYTAKELMLQLAFQIVPAVIAATVIGTAISVLAVRLLIGMIGAVPINLPAVLLLDLAIIAFCFGCAYLGARKIKKISVYELMTE